MSAELPRYMYAEDLHAHALHVQYRTMGPIIIDSIVILDALGVFIT